MRKLQWYPPQVCPPKGAIHSSQWAKTTGSIHIWIIFGVRYLGVWLQQIQPWIPHTDHPHIQIYMWSLDTELGIAPEHCQVWPKPSIPISISSHFPIFTLPPTCQKLKAEQPDPAIQTIVSLLEHRAGKWDIALPSRTPASLPSSASIPQPWGLFNGTNLILSWYYLTIFHKD